MIKSAVAAYIRKAERLLIPKLRKNQLYQTIRSILLLPLATILHALDFLISTLALDKFKKPMAIKKLNNIVDGWKHLAFPDQEVERIAMERAKICAGCPFAVESGLYGVVKDNKTSQIQGMKCAACGCALSAKIRSLDEYCPKGRW